MEGYIHSTESYGTVDGPGTRFVIFFQGCPMRCQYCHNPDTWTYNINEKRTVESLLHDYDGLKEFYHDGGITATGGEPLVQMEFLTELFTKAKERNINTCLDTSGILFRQEKREAFDKLMAVTDLVMLDIKHIDDTEHRKLTGQSNVHILESARCCSGHHAARKISAATWSLSGRAGQPESLGCAPISHYGRSEI